jgi:hypothetical protein
MPIRTLPSSHFGLKARQGQALSYQSSPRRQLMVTATCFYRNDQQDALDAYQAAVRIDRSSPGGKEAALRLKALSQPGVRYSSGFRRSASVSL